METQQLRNIAIIGPHGVGKTTLVEAMLFDMGTIPTRGRLENGSTTTDFDPEEHQRLMSLGTAVASGTWRDATLNLLDTPGSGDFLDDVKFALAAADAALLVINAGKGVDANVRKAFKLAKETELPVGLFINGVEQDNAREYAELLKDIHEQLDPHAVPLELPIGKGKTLIGDVDLVGMHSWYFAPETGQVTEVSEMPAELRDQIQHYHTELVEAIAELHDELLERYLGGEEPSSEELRADLKADLLAGKLTPVLCGSALTNLGIRPLLDALVDLMPGPTQRNYPSLKDADSGAKVAVTGKADASPVLAVFKTFSDPYLGKISLFRVLEGTVTSDAHLYDANRRAPERMGRLFKLVGKKQIPVDKLEAGDIGGVAKLKEALTGDTLLLEGRGNWIYPMPEIPTAIWSVAISPVSRNDEAKLAISLGKLKEEDPALSVTVESRTHRTVLSGRGQTHLEVTLSKLSHRHNVEVLKGDPQIPYRETVSGTAQGQGKHKKQTGGHGQYGDVWLKIEPLPRGTGFEFVDAVVGGAVPRNFIPAVEKGVRESLDMGLLAGYPIVDVRVTLYDGSSHSVDSSEMAFKTASHLAMKKIFEEAHPLLLEPIMDVVLTIPEEALGDAMGDLNTRRAQIEGLESGIIRTKLPLAEFSGLVTALQSYSRGQGTLESSFAGYQEVPAHLQAKLLSELKQEVEAATH